MIDGRELDNYPVSIVQEMIEGSIKDFPQRYIMFQDSHTDVLMALMKFHSSKIIGFEEGIRKSLEMRT